MLRHSPFGNTPTYKLLLGFGLCSLGGAMLYAYFKTRNDDEDDKQEQQPPGSAQQKQQQKPAQKDICIKMVVANDHVPLIVGRGGTNIKLIEEKAAVKIRLRDKDSGHKFCDITGQPDAVKLASMLLTKEIERAPIVKVEVQVTQRLANKFHGRGDEIIGEICRNSLAKVTIDTNGRNGKAKVIIEGNQKQVNIARKLLDEQIEQDEELRRAVEEVELKREPRRSPSNSVNSSLYSSQTSLSSHVLPRDKLLAARTDAKPMEVYVSAAASPSKFWVQLVGPQSKKLDDMVQEMTSYYSSAENRAKHVLSSPHVGQIVAAIFKFDEKWYRAEIMEIMPNPDNPQEQLIDLYFVDYGDSEYVSPADVCELRTDFLTLRFQAVECFLANVKSPLLNEPDHWPKATLAKFDELTEVAHWRKLIARVVTYKERSKTIQATGQSNAVGRDGTPLPGVELFDPTEGCEINLGHILIAQGFALALDDFQPVVRSRSSTPSTQCDTTVEELSCSTPPTPLSPMTTSLTNELENASAAENEHFENQLQHLKKKLQINGNVSTTNAAAIDPVKLSVGGLQNSNTDTKVSSNSNSRTTNGNFNL